MSNSDRDLGMDRPITRRDFLNGVGVTVGSVLVDTALVEAFGDPQQAQSAPAATDYPPARSGMRGSHPGSFEVAHSLRTGNTWGAGTNTGEVYDLVVVGGGMSGL